MAEPENGSGSNDRATVRLVQAEVREVKAIIEGHAATSAAELRGINQRLIDLGTLASVVSDHTRDLATLRVEVQALKDDRAYRLGPQLMSRIGWVSILVAIATVVVTKL